MKKFYIGLAIVGGLVALGAVGYNSDWFGLRGAKPPKTTPTPATLPQGKIVFVKSSYLPKLKAWDESIWIADKDVKNQKRLLTAPKIKGRKLWIGPVSPNGKKIIYSLTVATEDADPHTEEVLGILDLIAGKAKVVAKADSGLGSYPTGELVNGGIGDATWYEDGRKIIYALHKPGSKKDDLKSELRVYDLETDTKELFLTSQGIVRDPLALSPSNSFLYVHDWVFVKGSGIITQIDLSNKTEKQLVLSNRGDVNALLSPDGTKLVYSVLTADRAGTEVWIMNVGNFGKHKLLDSTSDMADGGDWTPFSFYRFCCISPSGRKFLTFFETDENGLENHASLATLSEDFIQVHKGLNLISEINETLGYRDPVIGEDGFSWVSDNILLVQIYEPIEGGRDIVGLLDLNTITFKKLLEDIEQPVWVPTQTSAE